MSEYWKSVPKKFCDFCKCWITDNKPAALEAFKKDLKDNPELAAQYGVSLEPKPPTVTECAGRSSTLPTTDRASTEVKSDRAKEWYEVVSAEGYHYYWNTGTGAPKEYVSLQEQEVDQSKDASVTGAAKESPSEAADAAATSEDVKPALAPRLDPSNSRSAYGGWDVVKEIERPVIYNESSLPPPVDDIPLPADTQEDNSLPPPKLKFKEKTVTSISSTSGGAVAFKKRKIASGARNVRQKDSND